jgi:hydrogenase expression/formation protein HypD
MAIKYLEEYRSLEISQTLMARIREISTRPVRLMEVCGTHTVALFRSGIRSMLPPTIRLLSGPGCPVCVTDQGEIDAFIELANTRDVIVATFGDLMRVPGSGSSLQQARAAGSDVRVVYSAFDALDIARRNPSRPVVFLGVGFETTAPTIAATIVTAQEQGLENFSVFCAHKRVPPALEALLSSRQLHIDGLLLPGHVSVIIGVDAYRPLVKRHAMPCVVAGFEAVDLLQALVLLIEQIETGKPQLANAYPRAVTDRGNTRALEMLAAVFMPCDARWRGIGVIADSGLEIREGFAAFDAGKVFGITACQVPDPPGCACGEILTGSKTPPQCSLYKTVCTPADPVGPCMVSSEGTCAAYYRYDQSAP